MPERCLLFVYGTLMRDQTGHHHLGNAAFLGRTWSPPMFRMVVLSWYPAIYAGDRRIEGEVFEVSRAQLAALDAYEGDEYLRQTIPTKWGSAFIYVGQFCPPGLPEVHSGRWRDVARSPV